MASTLIKLLLRRPSPVSGATAQAGRLLGTAELVDCSVDDLNAAMNTHSLLAVEVLVEETKAEKKTREPKKGKNK